MDLMFIRLPEPNNEDSVMIVTAVLGETFVRGDEKAMLSLGKIPQLRIRNPLQWNARDVFIHEDFHGFRATSVRGVTCSSARLAA
jgi:hypothetical protein